MCIYALTIFSIVVENNIKMFHMSSFSLQTSCLIIIIKKQIDLKNLIMFIIVIENSFKAKSL